MIDMLPYVKQLTAAGTPPAQAYVIAESLRETFGSGRGRPADTCPTPRPGTDDELYELRRQLAQMRTRIVMLEYGLAAVFLLLMLVIWRL